MKMECRKKTGSNCVETREKAKDDAEVAASVCILPEVHHEDISPLGNRQ